MLLTIEKLVYGGDGLARLPADEQGRAKAAFMPFVLEGEKVEATVVEDKKSFARARADRVVEPSPHRSDPQCPYFLRCGGCHYQHASYDHQLEIKAAIVKENLRRIAKRDLDTELVVHASPAWNYRNRSRLKVQTKPEFAVGYYEFNSHRLLPIEQCPISSPLINRAISAIWKSGQEGRIHAGIQEIELFTNADDSQLLGEIYCSAEGKADAARELAQKLKADLPAAGGVVVFQTDHLRPAEPRRIAAAGAGALTYKIASSSYRVSAGAFFQSNRHLIDELVSLVTKDLSGDVALDLYAGVGLFSSVLAKSFAQVIAVEASPTAHADLAYNSPANVRSVREIAELFLKRAAGELRPSFVVVDPPRNGLGETVVRSLARLGPERITYVSCDPATVARDLAGLFEGGYRIQQAHLVDLFPQTYHIESVFQLSR